MDTEMEEHKLCFICRQSTLLGLFSSLEDGGAFEFLCQLFHLNAVRKLESKYGQVHNYEFCEMCAKKIQDAMMTWTQMKFLQEQLEDIKEHIMETMSRSYCHLRKKQEAERSTAENFGLLMSQCLTPCRVTLTRMPGDSPETEKCEPIKAKAKPRKKKIKMEKGIHLTHDLESKCSQPPKKKMKAFEEEDKSKIVSGVDVTDTASTETENVGGCLPEVDHTNSDMMDEFFECEIELPSIEDFRGGINEEKNDDEKGVSRGQKTEVSSTENLLKPLKPKKAVSTGKKTEVSSTEDLLKPLKPKKTVFFDSEGQLKCRLCGEIFVKMKLYKKHLNDVHQTTISGFCRFCGRNFNQDRMETDPDSFQCDQIGCTRTYKSARLLREHHEGKCPQSPKVQMRAEKRFKCNQCDKAYFRAPHLRYHINTIHKNAHRFCCEECGSRFWFQAELREHQNTVHAPMQFKCDECGEQFRRANQLMYHRRRHTGEVPFVCEQCGKGFIRPEHLSLHKQNIHSTVMLPCPLCDKQFRSRSYLRDHMNRHQKKGPRVSGRTSRKKGSSRDALDIATASITEKADPVDNEPEQESANVMCTSVQIMDSNLEFVIQS